jgi:hypothetical protein
MSTIAIFIVLFVIAAIIWLGVLHGILTRPDFDTASKILWVIVVIFVPVFGVILYWIAAQSEVSTTTQKSEALLGKPISGSDISGTPWENDPGHTKP